MTSRPRKFFLRDGSEVDEAAWRTKHADPDYIRVAETTLPSRLWVSTVWTGVDLEGNVPALIFETALFDLNAGGLPVALDEAQHPSETLARAGHAAMVERWQSRPRPARR
jgi:hypothetical protein